MDTIFALSSGAPPAGIAVVRVSGPRAGEALSRLAGPLPRPRMVTLATLRDTDCKVLDRAMILWLPGPATTTGEDVAELHLHGGRAVVAAVEAALASVTGLRRAMPGEFTRRAFANGRIDLAEAEGLADLLEAETELQRLTAVSAAGGRLSREVDGWRQRVLELAAQVEAALDFGDEDDTGAIDYAFHRAIGALADEVAEALARPRAERLREGFRVALAGPPNAGKSTLFNALVESEAAIASPMAGTTRDVLERSVSFKGVPFTFVDMAGLRQRPGDVVERIGIERAEAAIAGADLVLWLGHEGDGPDSAWEIEPQVDRGFSPKKTPRHRVSAVTGEGLPQLMADLLSHARLSLPKPGDWALNQRQGLCLEEAHTALSVAKVTGDPLLIAEHLRTARLGFDRLTGRAGTEDMFDALFGRFCLGK